ncbi:hypothetical protein MWU75_09630 [Ornithinimicrobium sp. F0845]|uniref:hypothetical protein n=1 Tax=Ornithinimicrobium sp. F0845 TaxID=2926412 RepID=UPI001FF0F890|nr:hypothetical protein [Ornithinimicrobium sp. F0845]MCK0112396.1 hypothetical protein [Ornithinimicrobium sp. F0845]
MPSTSPLPDAPGPDDFQALARSSPWRFGTLHFTHRPHDGAPVEAWLRRPGHLEVLVGGERHVETGVPYSRSVLYFEEPPTGLRRLLPRRSLRPGGRWAAVPGLAPRDTQSDPPIVPPQDVDPVRRPDGLVLERPFAADYDDPMWHDYRWVAMLDPVELSRGVEVSEVHTRERFGRLTWTATCRPLPATSEDLGDGYDPRCSCCALLFGAVSQALEFTTGDERAPSQAEVAGYPSAYWVSLDVETGIVVNVEPQDGDRARTAFTNEIHEVGGLG